MMVTGIFMGPGSVLDQADDGLVEVGREHACGGEDEDDQCGERGAFRQSIHVCERCEKGSECGHARTADESRQEEGGGCGSERVPYRGDHCSGVQEACTEGEERSEAYCETGGCLTQGQRDSDQGCHDGNPVCESGRLRAGEVDDGSCNQARKVGPRHDQPIPATDTDRKKTDGDGEEQVIESMNWHAQALQHGRVGHPFRMVR